MKTQPRKAREFGCEGKRKLKVFVIILFPFIKWLRWLLPPHVMSITLCFYDLLGLHRIRFIYDYEIVCIHISWKVESSILYIYGKYLEWGQPSKKVRESFLSLVFTFYESRLHDLKI